METDALGNIRARHDYLAYGEDVTEKHGNVGGRTAAMKYGGSDGVRKQYTGYEKDDESGLDFAQARYYSSLHGRYTGVDPLTASADTRNPQTFNRYFYVLNSPYKFTDPLGLISSNTGACGQWCPQTGQSGGGWLNGYSDYQVWASQLTPDNSHVGLAQAVCSVSCHVSGPSFEAGFQARSNVVLRGESIGGSSAPILDSFGGFENGSPTPRSDGPLVPGRAVLVGQMEGDDARGRPYSHRNIYNYRETLLFQIVGSDGKPYLVMNSNGEMAEVQEEVIKLPGGIEPETMQGMSPKTGNTRLNSDARFADDDSYSVTFGGDPLPDDLNVVKRQIIWVIDPNTGKRHDVGHFEYRWTKNTLTVTDYTRGKDNIKTYTYGVQ